MSSKHRKSGKQKEKTFAVERVVDRRVLEGGRIEFKLKWEGYPESENSWEPASVLDSCAELIEEYERKQGLSSMKRPLNSLPSTEQKNGPPKKRKKDEGHPEAVGFEYGDVCEKIIGCTISKGDSSSKGKKSILLLVKWKEKNAATFVPSSIVNVRAPQKVIEFYESRLEAQRY
mmetsp:Transcript_29859/g.41248  ORF Transcript_29859/g.41248 Transcript_29859/m.41248 type:complete len:174 (+) Transcript_29859:92-613(+)